MSSLNSLGNRLAGLEQEIQTLPGQLDSMVSRLDRGKWRSLLLRVNEDLNKLLDELSTPQISGAFPLPLIFDPQTFSFTPVTSEDRARWRAAHKSDIRVVIGKGQVRLLSVPQIVGNRENAAPQKTPASRQQDCIVMNWDQYQKLLNEIDKLIIGNDE